MTPRSVIDAGRAERTAFRYVGPFTSKQVWRVYPNIDHAPEAVFVGTKTECQDFIDDRVYQAMLAADTMLTFIGGEPKKVSRHGISSTDADSNT